MENEEGAKKTKKRSSSYPGFNLEDALGATQQLKQQLGDGPYSRDAAAIALGYAGITGSSSTKISACVQFGLLVKTGNSYAQSELAGRIFNYVSDEERHESLVKAFKNPALYSKLIDEYDSKSLPLMLENILIRNYGIQEKAAKNAAGNFRTSAEYVGALKNGVLVLPINVGSTSGVAEEDVLSEELKGSTGQRQRRVDNVQQFGDELPVTIPGTGIVVLFPAKFAFSLSIGAFSKGITQLADDAKKFETPLDSDVSEVDVM